jgi:MtN3 and saliva related transmembrane protein
MRDFRILLLEAGTRMMLAPQAINAIGYAAATLTTISFLPQLIRVVKLRSARDISLGMFLIFTTGTGFWLTYGIVSHSAPVTIANAVTFVLSLSILVLKLRYDRQAMLPHPTGAPR